MKIELIFFKNVMPFAINKFSKYCMFEAIAIPGFESCFRNLSF